MKRLTKQILYFICTSGVGWLLDFGCYTALIFVMSFDVAYANMISAVPAFTFVFITSRSRIFVQKENGKSLKTKYMIYFVYQILLVVSVSFMGQYLFDWGMAVGEDWPLMVLDNLKLIVKFVITPITMSVNFVVMKLLYECL